MSAFCNQAPRCVASARLFPCPKRVPGADRCPWHPPDDPREALHEPRGRSLQGRHRSTCITPAIEEVDEASMERRRDRSIPDKNIILDGGGCTDGKRGVRYVLVLCCSRDEGRGCVVRQGNSYLSCCASRNLLPAGTWSVLPVLNDVTDDVTFTVSSFG